MSQLQFEYPASFLLLCALVAIGYAAFLYYRDRRWADQSNVLPWLLGVARAVVVFVLTVLLLSPFLTYYTDEMEQPSIVVAYDNSESIEAGEEGQVAQLRSLPGSWEERLEDYPVEEVSFAEDVTETDSLSFEGKQTNISQLFGYLDQEWPGQSIGAIVLMTDGLYNVGANPQYLQELDRYPVFTVPLGDTSAQRDLKIREVFHNDIAYLGDEFVIQTDIQATDLEGRNSVVQLSHSEGEGKKLLEEKKISIEDDHYFETLEFQIPADASGVQEYNVRVVPLEGEVSTLNNSRNFYVEVLDTRQKILVFGGAPHPDLGALRQILSRNKNYEVDVGVSSQHDLNIKGYDLVIVHQLPFAKRRTGIISRVLDLDVPQLFITGLETDVQRLNQMQDAIQIRQQRGSPNAVHPVYNENFNAFSVKEEDVRELTNYPPLETFFGEFESGGRMQTVFRQKVGEVESDYPLFVIGSNGDERVGYILAEGIWRWNLQDQQRQEGDRPGASIIEQMVQYVSIRDDKRRFRVRSMKNLYAENENIRIRAELYDENFRLVNEPDAFLNIQSDDGEQYEFTFARENNFYSLEAGVLPPGQYNYVAETDWNGEEFRQSGQFTVEEIQLELYQTRADHNILNLIAERSGGAVIPLNQLDSLEDALTQLDSLKPILYSRARTQAVIQFAWIFWMLVLLLAIEWFVRRWVGSY